MSIARVGDIHLNYTVHGAGDWLVLVGGYASGNAKGRPLALFRSNSVRITVLSGRVHPVNQSCEDVVTIFPAQEVA